MAMSSCCGARRKQRQADTEALLAEYDDDTDLQQRLHEKIHTYQMLRALASGYLPTSEQLIINLRTLLAADILQADDRNISFAGKRLTRLIKDLIRQFIDIVQTKNKDEEVQSFLWHLSKSRVSFDMENATNSAAQLQRKAETAALGQSLKTISNLLLANSDFRVLLNDLGLIARQTFASTAATLSSTANDAAHKMELSSDQKQVLVDVNADQAPPTATDLKVGAAEVSEVVGDAITTTGREAISNLEDNLSGDQRSTLLQRLKKSITTLRQKPDYQDSVDVLSRMLREYIITLAHLPGDAADAASEGVSVNEQLQVAIQKLWELAKAFGNGKNWDALEQKFLTLKEESQSNPDFERLISHSAQSLQQLLSDPQFFDDPEKALQVLEDDAAKLEKDSTLTTDVRSFLTQIIQTWKSVLDDTQVKKLVSLVSRISDIISPPGEILNKDLFEDMIRIFIPLLIQTIQYLPIPRLEVSVPEADVLLENLIFEPGHSVNNTSFFPFKLSVETYNNFELRKTHTHQTTHSMKNFFTVTIQGLSLKAADFGYWLRLHSGSLFSVADEGIASFELDDRGIDIALDVEIGRERLEHIFTLRKVRVQVHKFSYTLRRSSFSWLAWLAKPVLTPIFKRMLEKNIAIAIADFCHAANRELLFARERLRATRISDPQDVRTFIQAVITRLTPRDDPDLYTRIGFGPGKGRFAGVYAPGSLVKLWEDEARHVRERLQDEAEVDAEGWKHQIFDVKNTRSL